VPPGPQAPPPMAAAARHPAVTAVELHRESKKTRHQTISNNQGSFRAGTHRNAVPVLFFDHRNTVPVLFGT